MDKGPFVKGHYVFDIIKEICCDLKEFMGITYETGDSYSGVWFRNTEAAENIRKTVNERVGWSIISKPCDYDKYDDDNPFTCDAVCVGTVPKDISDRNDKYNGDAMIGALMECAEMGVQIKF